MRDDSTSETGVAELAAPVDLAPLADPGAPVLGGWIPRADAFGAVTSELTTELQS
mgnify:CR=1 FL=1